jgi:hypothetical protein
MRISWVHPDEAERAREVLRQGHSSWEDLFDAHSDTLVVGAPPSGFDEARWPTLAEHVARTERVREVVARAGIDAAHQRFASSPFAIERAALFAAQEDQVTPQTEHEPHVAALEGMLGCPIDELIAYGHFLSRLVELGLGREPSRTVVAFEQFVEAAVRVSPREPSWPERLQVARDGLAALYVRVGRAADGDALYCRRFHEEPRDMTISIGAARAFLEAGDVSRSVVWLERAAARAQMIGRHDLGERLLGKVVSLRSRMS